MPKRSDPPSFALLIIDVINALDFPEGKKMLRQALPMAKHLQSLKKRLRRRGIPIIYCNDNYGQWRSDFREVIARCSEKQCLGAPLTELLLPGPEDYFVLKPQHSAFYETPLEILLTSLGVRRLVLTGIAADSCVLATAMDAHMRGYEKYVPSDCVASSSPARKNEALAILRQSMRVDTRAARLMDW